MTFEKLKVATRLNILVALAVIGLIAISTFGLMQLKQSMLTDRQTKLKNVVELAMGVADSYKKQADAGKMSMDEAKLAAAATIRQLRYSQTEYFFALDNQGKYYVQGLKPELEGTTVLDNKDSRGFPLNRAIIEMGNKGGGYLNYWYAKPSDTSKPDFPKMSYIAQRVEQIAHMVDETAITISGTAETASQLEQIAQELKEQIRRFKL